MGVFVPTFVAAHRVTPCPGILRSPLPWLPHPCIRTGGPLCSPSPEGSLWECIPHWGEGWNRVLQGRIQAYGALIKGIPHHREQIPSGCPGKASSRPGIDPAWAIRYAGREVRQIPGSGGKRSPSGGGFPWGLGGDSLLEISADPTFPG